ncbi:two-component system sensor histidine kinase NtrB [Desulforamulus ruminis]|uniref:histidine kinase n=1 Tax=Desulforamulus ruminis (strain ATCC 23193 / DSM 2154 / NCIMB 8452 / DL) TaxID=696281 RepID=F6DLD1_DESRL|nr:ATP-binding protein [Desulforamulus ruminis]AEG60479.1 PAS sensor protein [Desulforamulus ruminis DSM 2154]
MPRIGLWGIVVLPVTGMIGLFHWALGTFHLSPWLIVFQALAEVLLAVAVFYFVFIRGEKKEREKEHHYWDKQLADHKQLLEYLPLAVLFVDRQGTIMHMNNLAREIADIKDNVKNIYQNPHGAEDPLELLKKTLESKQVFQEYDYTCRLVGESKYYRLNTSLIQDEDGQPLGALLTGFNISEQFLLEEQLSQRGKLAMIGELAAGTAHEIRNPLTSVRGLVQILGQRLDKNDSAQEYIKMMLSEIDHINYIIKELLLLARRTSPNLSFISLPALLDDALLLLEGQANSKGIFVYKEYSNELPLVVLDEDQMKQVFINLATNAIHAMPDGGELVVSAEYVQQEESIVVKFKDTGIGIAKENISRIFHPFFTTRPEGTGLGLPVSYQIVDNHGGKLMVESISGSGSTFIIKIPLVNRENIKAS